MDKINQVWWSADVGKWGKKKDHPDNQSEKQTHSPQAAESDWHFPSREALADFIATHPKESRSRECREVESRAGEMAGSLGRSSLSHSGEGSLGSFVQGKCRAFAFRTEVCLGIKFLLPVLTDSTEHWIEGYVLPNGRRPSSFLQCELHKCKVKLSGTSKEECPPGTSEDHSLGLTFTLNSVVPVK